MSDPRLGGPSGPAQGTRVLVLGRELPVDYASMILADVGADVVMVEDPDHPASFDDVTPAADGLSYYRLAYCRNKRSVALRTRVPGELDVVRRLLSWADVVLYDSVDAGRRGLADVLAQAVAGRSELIVCDAAPWGSFGEAAGRSGNELTLQAVAGCMDLTGEFDDPPTRAGVPVMSFVTGSYVAIAVLAALYERQRTGLGRRVEVAGYDAAVAVLSNMASAYYATGEHRSRLGTGHITIFPYNAFRTSDGEIVIAIFTQAFWSKFCVGIGRADLLDEPRYKTIPDRMRAKDELSEILDALFLERTTDEWRAILEKADVPYGPVLSVGEALTLDQTTAREMTPLITGLPGAIRTVGSPLRFRFSDGSTFRPSARRAPWPGEHDAESITADPARNGGREASQATTSLPLTGVRVVDFTRMFAGPWAAEILSDLGATVVKVEEPRIGDPTRRHRPLVGDESSYFMAVNRGKRSLAVDARTDQGRQLMLDLIKQADIVVENFRPGVMDRLGLGYDAVSSLKPDLVYCSLSGFGADGPMRERISFDIVNQAFAGLIDVTGHPNSRASRIGVPIGDLSGGLYMSVAVLAGLLHRDATGLGCWVDLGLHDTLVALLGDLGQRQLLTGESPSRLGNLHQAAAPHGCFATEDGWIALASYSTADWDRLVSALDLPAEDAQRFATLEARLADQAALQTVLERRFKVAPTQSWVGLLQSHGIACEPVMDIKQTLDSSTLATRELGYQTTLDGGDSFTMLASPMVFDGYRLGRGSVAPRLGEYTAQLMAEFGHPPERIDELVEARTIRVGS